MEYNDEDREGHAALEPLDPMPTVGNEVEIGVEHQAWEPDGRQQILQPPNLGWPENPLQLRMIQDIYGAPPIVQLARIDFPLREWNRGANVAEVDPPHGPERQERIVEPPQEADDNARPAELAEAPIIGAPFDEILDLRHPEEPPIVIVEDSNDDTRTEPDELEPVKKKIKLDTKEKQQEPADSGNSDEGRICPICMDYWSNSGDHRLCSLRCGHLFGQSCVLHWLTVGCTNSNRRCPQCNKKASVRDVRVIYATNVQVSDTVEINLLKDQLQQMTSEKNRLEMELSKYQLRQRMYDDQITNLTKTIRDLEKQKFDMSLKVNDTIAAQVKRKFHLEHTVEICKSGGCRVLDHSSFFNCIVATQKSGNALFPGYGIKKIDIDAFRPMQFMLLHTQAIRDLAFHPAEQSLLLSVSFDKTAKLLDVRSNIVVHGFTLDSQVWSCCWSGDNSNIFNAGIQNGSIMQFDIRRTSGAIDTLHNLGDRSPIVALATVPSNSSAGIIRGGFLAAHLNTCYAYEPNVNAVYTAKEMFLDGPFVSIRYDNKNHHALISSRPNSRITQARHVVLSVESTNNDGAVLCNIVHTFNGGNSQKLLSRPCHVNVDNETFVAAHHESSSCIPLWSVSTGVQSYSLPISDPVLDMCSFDVKGNHFLATLSAQKLRLYNYQ